jgi:TP901 family phage tail tape measure protein
MMALTVDEINVVLGADISGFQSQMGSAGSTIRGLGGFASSAGKVLSVGLTLPILAMGKASIDAASNFDQSMANIRALTGATGTQMAELSKLALKMGQDTTFSASEASDGMLELLKSGLSVEQVMGGGLKGALDLAAAGGISLSEAATVGSTALNAFRDDGLSMSDAADILAGAANASAADVGSLALGLSQASAVAAGVGLTFEDTATALALFANNGLKGSDAGTSLKTMLLNLQPTTKEQIALFDKLGLTTAEGTSAFFDQQGKLKSLSEIAGLLQGSLSGMTDAQKLSTLETIFGTDAIRAANIIFKEGADGVNNLKAQIGNVSAEQVATERMNSFKGTVEQLKGSLETAGIALGTAFLPLLKILADALKTVADWFVSLNPNVQLFIGILLGVAAAVGPLLLLFGGLAAAIASITAAAAILGIGALALVGWMALIPIAIAGIIAIGVLLIKHWDEIKAFALKVWQEIKDAIHVALVGSQEDIDSYKSGTITSWSSWLEYVKTKTAADWQELKDTLSSTLTSIGTSISTNAIAWGTSINDWLIDVTAKFGINLPEWENKLVLFFDNMATKIPEKLALWGGSIQKWIDDTKTKWDTNLPIWETQLGTFFDNMPAKITEKLTLWKKAIQTWLEDQHKQNMEFYGKLGDDIVKWYDETKARFVAKLGEWWESIGTWYEETKKNIRTKLETWWTDMGTWYDETKKNIRTKLDDWWNGMGQWYEDTKKNIRTKLNDWWNDMGTWFEETKGNIRGKLEGWWQELKNWFSGIWKKPEVKNSGSNIITSFTEGLTSQKPTLISKIASTIVDGLIFVAAAAAIIALAVGREIIKRIASGIGSAGSSITDALGNIFNSIWSYISSQYNRLYNAAANIAAGFWKGFKSKLFGSPKTKMEYAFIAMSDQAKQTLSDIASLTPKYASTGSKIMDAFQPKTGLMTAGTPGGMGMGVTAPMTEAMATPMTSPAPTSYSEGGAGGGNWGGVQVSVAQLVVREEADVLKIAQQLYRLQKDRTRGRGTR